MKGAWLISKKKIWTKHLIWILLIQTISASAYYGYVPLIPYIEEEFLLSNAQIGWMTSSVFLGASLMSLPSGIIVDRLGANKTLLIFCLILAIVAAMFSFSFEFLYVLILLFLLGSGYGGITPGTNKSIMNNFETHNRGTAMGVKQTGVSLGSVLGTLLLPVIASLCNWKLSFLTISVLLFLISAFHYKILNRNEDIEDDKKNVAKEVFLVIRNKKLLKVIAVIIFFIWVQLSVMTYLVLYLISAASLKTTIAFVCLAFLQFGGAVGRAIWGAISDMFFYKKRGGVLGGIGILSGLLLLLLSGVSSNVPIILIVSLSFLLGITTQGWNGIFVLLLSEVVDKKHVGISSGVGLSVVYIGAILGTPLSGWIIDTINSYKGAWLIESIAMVFVGVVIFVIKIDHKKVIS